MSELSHAERWEGALCTQTDPELWFPDKGESTAMAKAICARCPFGPQGDGSCLDYCLTIESSGYDAWGVWGGTTVHERHRGPERLSRRQEGPRPISHGTYGGYITHRRRDEQPCGPCIEANAAYNRQKKLRREAVA